MTESSKNDVFAEIAAQRIDYRDGNLEEPAPPLLEKRYLPSNNDPSASFSPAEKIDSPEKLSEELKRYRLQFTPFLKSLAPEIPKKREKLFLSDFDWRVETQEDKKDFVSILSGKGQWEKVKVPHYGEPLGKAVTYYRTKFEISASQIEKGAAFIHFKGVDYKAHIFINGCYLGSHEGFFAPFEFDFTECANIGENVLVVKVENDYIMGGNNAWDKTHCGEKIYAATGLGYDEPYLGWHHCPPGMGIYQDVFVEFRPRIFVSDLFVRPMVKEGKAEAWIEVTNCDLEEKPVNFNLSLYGQNFDQTIFENLEYSPTSPKHDGLNDDLNIAFSKADGTYNKPIALYAEKGKNCFKLKFDVNNPRLWRLESPWLYQLQIELTDTDKNSIDAAKQHFGMRSFTMDTESKPKGRLFLNDEPIRLRGANTMGHTQQCVFKKDFDQLIDDILLAKICNMNFLRMTQRPVQPEIYDYCDKLGLMTQSDLPTFGCIRQTQYNEALKQVAEMERLVRAHPCNIMDSYINEPFPNGKNKPHRNITRDQMEDFFRAADDIIHHLNPERVIKPCDGDYDPPAPGIQDRHCYTTWYNGQGVDIGRLIKGWWQPTKKDWYYGCGEFGAEGLEREQLMRKYYPASWLPQSAEQEKNWTPSKIYKCQTGNFHYFFFDSQNRVQDWIEESQSHQERSLKAITEAFRRDNRMITIAVHLFIDAFPSGWMKTIMDCQRHPKKGYFAYRNALAPLLTTIRTDRNKFFSDENISFELWVCNDKPQTPEPLDIHYQIEDTDGKVIFSQRQKSKIEACGSKFQGFVSIESPEIDRRTAFTVRAALIDEKGVTVNENSTEIEVFPKLEYKKTEIAVLDKNGSAAGHTAELGLETADLENCETILIGDYEEYAENKDKIDALVKEGAKAVFGELCQEGVYQIGDEEIDVKESRFNPLHFVSRKTGHRLVEGFKEFDFNYWYGPAEDMITPVLERTFTAKGFEPVLTAGNADDNSNWCKMLACGEKVFGKGAFIVNQVKLAGRTQTNPTAKLFALRLLGIKTKNVL